MKNSYLLICTGEDLVTFQNSVFKKSFTMLLLGNKYMATLNSFPVKRILHKKLTLRILMIKGTFNSCKINICSNIALKKLTMFLCKTFLRNVLTHTMYVTAKQFSFEHQIKDSAI